MEASSRQSEYHNTKAKMPADVHPNFLLARLAWAVFPMIQNFFSRGEPRLVRVGQELREMTSQELRGTFFSRGGNSSPAKSRSNSPLKRPRNDTENQDMETRGAISNSPRREMDQTPELVNFETDSETNHIEALRQVALSDQRKQNANVMCCNYDAAQKAIAAGLEGSKLFGGAHLCLQCLGVEYRDE
jgi:hypothetical protein